MQISDLVFLDNTGYHYADYPSFRTYVQNVFRGIYGEDVYLENDSQDGQWTAALAQMAYDCATNGGSVYLSFSPATAQGVGLSRVVKINGISRITPTFSTADLTITGAPGTVITNGQAIDTLQQKWNLPLSVTIPGGGSIVVTATADDAGAVNAQPNTINSIFTPTRGWLTVNNVSAASVGQAAESDGELRVRQTISTANPSSTVFEGTEGAVANVVGVTASQGYENDTNSTDANGLISHSIAMVVQGGDNTAIAQAIADHKGPGCGTNGTTSVTVYDPGGLPLVIKFFRPTLPVISAQITLTPFQGYTSDYEPLIAQAVADFINSVGIGAVKTNAQILISKLYLIAYLPNVPAAQGTYDVVSIELKKDAGSFAAANVNLDFDELATCDPSTDVTVIT